MMIRSKHFKKFIIIEISCLLLFTFFSFVSSLTIYDYYRKSVINNNAYIVSSIIKNHPEYEEEIVDLILNNDSVINGEELLKKYGLDQLNYLDYQNSNKEIKQKIIVTNVFVMFLGLIFMLVFFFFYILKNQKQLNEINVYVKKILNNDYSMDIREYDEDELSTLKNELYKMTVKLNEQMENSKKDKRNLEETLSDISHQIKTPLTSMNLVNDLLENEIEKDIKKEFLSKNKIQLERIDWLVSSLLKISRLDSGSAVLKKEKVNLLELIDSSLEPLKIPIELKDIEVVISGNPIYANLNFNWTREALINIIKNAYEHTSEKGKIEIAIDDNPLFTSITITDNGCGIARENIAKVFDRFYKCSSDKNSIGIGLNMSKKIIDMQNGDIMVNSVLNKGTSFIIKFYKKNI